MERYDGEKVYFKINEEEARKQNLKKDVCANYNYETEENLLCTVRRYLRCFGRWPKI